MSEIRVLQPTDIEAILTFERDRLRKHSVEPIENEMQEWIASWRQESLEHYLPLGWSFAIFKSGQMQGYFLGQPQLFFRGMTQTLWVERIAADTSEVYAELVDVACRIAREKRFQKVLFYLEDGIDLSHSVFQLERITDRILEIKTAKF